MCVSGNLCSLPNPMDKVALIGICMYNGNQKNELEKLYNAKTYFKIVQNLRAYSFFYLDNIILILH